MTQNGSNKESIRIYTPFDKTVAEKLFIGDRVLINGTIYTARDAAHKRLVELIANEQPLPFALEDQIIYYVGPTPAAPGRVIGAAGPTTSYRMDSFAPVLIEKGLRGMIGKGSRSTAVKEAIRKYQAVYFAAIGGAGALISQCIFSAEVIAYPELGPEAINKLSVKDLPAIVVNDVHGGDLYEKGVEEYSI